MPPPNQYLTATLARCTYGVENIQQVSGEDRKRDD
jgi:hypothetical protein